MTDARMTLAIAMAIGAVAAVPPGVQVAPPADGRMPAASPASPHQENQVHEHPYLGMWVTSDGQIRQELLPDGRYDEARGRRKSAYQGRYHVDGNHIEYWDDTGFTADGIFVTIDELHHGGMVFYRER